MLGAVVLYVFLLHVHLDGRMIDVYRRVHAPEDRFFVPHDFEVSAAELKWVVDRAKRWRGARGTTRKVAVCDYVLTDPLDAKFREVRPMRRLNYSCTTYHCRSTAYPSLLADDVAPHRVQRWARRGARALPTLPATP